MIYLLIVILVFIGSYLFLKPKSKPINSVKKTEQKEVIPSFKNVNLDDGEYALYIKKKDIGEFIVTNKEALKKNQNILDITRSWMNFMPGEGDRSYGAILFKNRQKIWSEQGGIFKKFEIGDLVKYGVSVKQERFNGTKKEIENKLVQLKNDTNSFIAYEPKLSTDDKEFHFRIYFPSIAVPITKEIDSGFHEKWETQLSQCIRSKAGKITDFDISISNGTSTGAYLFDVNDKRNYELRSAENHILYLKDFMFYEYTAHIKANKENAQKLLALDYSDCLSVQDCNKTKVLEKMKALVKQSTKPNLSVEKNHVGIDGYKDQTEKYKSLYEQEYQISWFEIKEQK